MEILENNFLKQGKCSGIFRKFRKIFQSSKYFFKKFFLNRKSALEIFKNEKN